MSVLKNMEAWLVLLFGLIIACAYVHDVASAPAAAARPEAGPAAAPMPVVVISAKRPNAAQKPPGN
ncbi:MAG TPA: hypothetical protein VFG03_23375 [Telluria sp.]|nr:hypothetical protein [Telluria sp.]